jgi:hypothetical protein
VRLNAREGVARIERRIDGFGRHQHEAALQ